MSVPSPITLLRLGKRATQFYLQRLPTGLTNVVDCDFEDLNEYLPDQFKELVPRLEMMLDGCNNSDGIIMPNITLHETVDHYCESQYQSLPIIHPLAGLAGHGNRSQHRRVVIFGSQYTMQSPYVARRCGSPILKLNIDEQKFVDQLRRAVYSQNETHAQLADFKRLLDKYSEKANVVVACTELSLVIDDKFVASRGLIDLSRLQIDAAMEIIH